MAVLIIGWSIYDKLSEEEQKEFALVERYRNLPQLALGRHFLYQVNKF